MLLFITSLSVLTVYAEEVPTARPITVSIFEEVNNSYKLKDANVSYDGYLSLKDLLGRLKKEKAILGYTVSKKDNLLTIKFNDNTVTKKGGVGKNSGFITNINGRFYRLKASEALIKSGDVVKLIYTLDTATDYNSNMAGSTIYRDGEKSLVFVWNDELSAVLNNSCNKIADSGLENVSSLISLGLAKKKAPHAKLLKLVKEMGDEFKQDDIDYVSRVVLALYACGIDARNVNNTDYVKLLCEIGSKDDVFTTIDKMYLCMLALSSVSSDDGGTRILKSKLKDRVLLLQSEQGGFKKSENQFEDALSTEKAILALSPFISEKKVSVAVDDALGYLSSELLDESGFRETNLNTAEKAAFGIMSLLSVNISLDDKRFSYGEDTLVDILLSYYKKDGSFSDVKDGNYSEKATNDAIRALFFIKRGRNPFLLLKTMAVSDVKGYEVKEVDDSFFTKVYEYVISHKKLILTVSLAILLSLALIIIIVKRRNNAGAFMH